MSFHQLHHNEISTLHLAHFVDFAYVRLIRGGRSLCLAWQQVLHFCADAPLRRKNLDCYVAFETFITRAIDFSHPSRANLVKNPVVAEHLANHGGYRLLANILGCAHGQVKSSQQVKGSPKEYYLRVSIADTICDYARVTGKREVMAPSRDAQLQSRRQTIPNRRILCRSGYNGAHGWPLPLAVNSARMKFNRR